MIAAVIRALCPDCRKSTGPTSFDTTQAGGSRRDSAMLNQHSHTVIPESDHLRIGDCVLDLPRREIASPHGDAPMRITVKAL